MCQNVSQEFLLTRDKFQAKIPSHYKIFSQGGQQKYTLPLRTKGKRTLGTKRLYGTGHNEISFWGSIGVQASHLVHYNSLLQDSTDIIIKCNSYFIIKCNKSLFRNALGFLIKNAAFITKLRQFYHKMRQLLQNPTFITKY